MADNETPSRQHVSMHNDATIEQYRISELEKLFDRVMRRLEKLADRFTENETTTKIAIERCSSHGVDLKAQQIEIYSLKDELQELKRRLGRLALLNSSKMKVATFWTSVTALGGSVAALAQSIWGHHL